MKNLYARFVLWLIRPALRLQIEQRSAEAKRRADEYAFVSPDAASSSEIAPMLVKPVRIPTLKPGEVIRWSRAAPTSK